MKSLILTICLAMALPVWGQSAEAKKIPVKFTCTCTDIVGEAYATALRDALAKSPRYREAYLAQYKISNGKFAYNWQIKVVSMDPSRNSLGTRTVLSVVFLFGDTEYLDNVVQICGNAAASKCASATLASFDELLNTP